MAIIMKLTKEQYKLLAEVAESRERYGHQVRQVAYGFTGNRKVGSGYRETTIDALVALGFIATENVHARDTHQGFTRYGWTVYATVTSAGRAFLASGR